MNNNEWKWKVVSTVSGCKTLCSVFWVRKIKQNGWVQVLPCGVHFFITYRENLEQHNRTVKLLTMPKTKRHTRSGVTACTNDAPNLELTPLH